MVKKCRPKPILRQRGTTLIELLVATVIFSIFIAIVYPSLLFVRDQVTILNDRMALNDRGKRIIDFMADDLNMIGFIIGPTARIPYCTNGVTPTSPNTVTHVDGDPYDTLTFLTSIPVELDADTTCINSQTTNGAPVNDYLLTTTCNGAIGANQLCVDAAASCVGLAAASGNNNGRSLITFESIAPSITAVTGGATQFYYTISSFGNNNTINLSPTLVQNIPDNSSVFTLKQYRYAENGARDLQRFGWNSSCTNADLSQKNEYPSDTLDTSDGADGGIDGLQFEFLSLNTVSGLNWTSTRPADLTTLKAIKVWLLLRAEFTDENYTNEDTYTLGSITLGPFNDHYRRVLLTRTVEVKNLGF